MRIEPWDTRRDGPLSEESLRGKLEQRGYRVARYVYPPGTHFPNHSHEVDKIDAVLAGRFQMTVRGRKMILGPGDCIAVSKGTVHNARVLGDEPVVSLDATRF
jgi:mannose-6-phosphate isomerase-like protein (cupin superfamily)